MNSANEFGMQYATEQLRRSRSTARKAIKFFYLENILRDVKGKSIDFGCGAGQLLARLPVGSVGLEIDPHLVETLRQSGLNAVRHDAGDDFSLRDLAPGHFQTFVMAHVLEHFDEAHKVLRKILTSCRRLGIERAIIVVPGPKGYRSDKTHKTLVNRHYLSTHGLLDCEGYAVRQAHYFPINIESVGDYFTFHEFKFIYDRKPF